MFFISLILWASKHLARDPKTWLACVLLASILIAGAALGPVGITTADGVGGTLAYEVAFLASVLGGLFGMELSGTCEWMLHRAAPLRRTLAGLALIAGSAVPFLLAVWVASLLLGGAGRTETDGCPSLVLGSLQAVLHTSAVALVLSQMPLERVARLVSLPLLTWVLPALLFPNVTLGRILAQAFDTASHLRCHQESNLPAWNLLALPIIGWFGVALLLALRPHTHAVRDPR